MGCMMSSMGTELLSPTSDNSYEYKTDKDDVRKSKWRRGDTKTEAKRKYVLEGTLPIHCSDLMIELRGFLQEPILLAGFGRYAKDCKEFSSLMCWADILEFKHIDEKCWDFRTSQFIHIYTKYIGEGAVCDLSEVLASMSQTWLTKVQFTFKAIKNGYEQPVQPNLFDKLSHQCLQHMAEGIFAKFKKTVLYKLAVKDLKQTYNQISLDDFEYYDLLGRGGYGFVVHCMKKTTGIHYAMKIQTKCGLLDCFDDCRERVVFEKEAVASCRHPFIVSMDYAFQSETLALMVMDLGTGTLYLCFKAFFVLCVFSIFYYLYFLTFLFCTNFTVRSWHPC